MIAEPLRIHDLPEEDRPRERLMKLGAEALTNAELLALFINTGRKGENAIQMAQRLLRESKTLRNLSRRGGRELSEQFHGLGPAKAAHIAAAFELGRRVMHEDLRREPMNEPELIYRYFAPEMSRLGHEVVRVLVLDTKMCLAHDELVFRGSLNASTAHPREILRVALVHRAHAFILAHNHPSGDPAPSEQDRRFTVRMKQCAESMQIEFADHIIIGAPRQGAQPWFSFKSAGLL
jgi:DNA repair protein RadC